MPKLTTTLFLPFLLLLITSCENPTQKNQSIKKQNGMLLIPSGTLNMGGDNNQADENELPKHKVTINEFWMDETEVTNAQFTKFTKATNYLTIAERPVIWEEIKASLPPNTPQATRQFVTTRRLGFSSNKSTRPLKQSRTLVALDDRS